MHTKPNKKTNNKASGSTDYAPAPPTEDNAKKENQKKITVDGGDIIMISGYF